VFALVATCYLIVFVLSPPAVAFQSTGAIDLELTKTVSPETVTVGENVTWTITVPNRGFEDATSVEVHDMFPAGVTYVSHSGGGTFNPSSGIWAIGSIPAEEQVTIEIVTSVDGVGEFVNAAEVTMADQDDIDSVPGDGGGDDWDDAVVTGTTGDGDLIDLELTLTIDPIEVVVGEIATGTVELVNQGPDDATGVAAEVTCPRDIAYVSHSGDGAFDSATGVWTVGDLDVGAEVSLDMVITVDTVGEWICRAEVSTADQEDVDSVPGDGGGDDWDDATVAATTTGDGELIDLELTLTAELTELTVGDTTTWTVDLLNQGPDDATGVAVVVTCPADVTYVSHGGDGAFDSATGVWTVGDVNVGANLALAITTTVDAEGIWTCIAEVTAADQEDVDSVPGDGGGDDWDDATVRAALVLASAIVGDTVWLDDDADGVQDAGEAGIAGVTVALTNIDTSAVITTATNADGLYLFAALDAGNYRVAIDMSTVDSKLTLTTAGSFTLALADNDAFLTADFGLAQQLPVTGFDPIPVSAFGLILLLLGAVALELMWPEREGRRLFVLRNLG
jgi:uncharacterized repeat protein (TIGR01451 family)